jgi:hypothetical protein
MPTVTRLLVADLKLDPENFRHMPQRTEERALHAMAALDTGYFWGLAKGLLESGYIERENIVVLKSSAGDKQPLVKEGNRRIGIMKLALGELKGKDLQIPESIEELMRNLTREWREKNKAVPCLVFEPDEEADANKLVDLTHGKGELAARLKWNAVASARHNRERNKVSEPSLDLLEAYIRKASNLTADEKEKWAADFPLTILHNALNLLAPRLGFQSQETLMSAYPEIPRYRAALDDVIRDIGRQLINTDAVRAEGFAVSYGIPELQAPAPVPSASPAALTQGASPGIPSSAVAVPGTAGSGTLGAAPAGVVLPPRARSASVNTQVSVRRKLRSLVFRGANRDKLVTLRNEAVTLSLQNQPHSFCFLLRAMFELSAKAYCEDHKPSGGPKAVNNGEDRKLVEVLRDIYNHMANAKAAASPDKKAPREWVKHLHGAMTELTRANSLFSVNSLNQLVHHESFTVTETHICSVFSNVFPMLEEMNR